MPTKNKPVQFSLNQAQHELLLSRALEGESPGQTAKRLLLRALDPDQTPVYTGTEGLSRYKVTGYSGTPEQIAGALAEAMGVLEEEVAEATLPPTNLGAKYGERVTAERELTVEDQQVVAKLVKGAAKKPTTTIEQERAQAAERYVVETPKLLRGWPPEVRSQDEIDFDDVPVIGAPPPELPEELPKKGRK